MTSDAALDFSSCPDNTPTIGLRQFRGTKGKDLVRVFYIAALLRIVESAQAPYSYPGFCNICITVATGIHVKNKQTKKTGKASRRFLY